MCDNCPALANLLSLGELPATLEYLSCDSCPTLANLLSLPATLTYFTCVNCTALTQLPPLPAAAFVSLRISKWTALPDAPPEAEVVWYHDCKVVGGNARAYWRRRVAAEHAADRRRVAASLPPLALLYV